jgi:hypothetical protein
MSDSSENVPQLHRLSQNEMKLSAFVELRPASIDVGLDREGSGPIYNQIWLYVSRLFQMMEV